MEYTITGRSVKKVSKALLRDAVEWYASRIFSKRLRDKIKLKIILKKLPTDLLGECNYNDPKHCDYNYTISLNNDMSERRMLTTLAHEMIHAKQYATGQFKPFKRNSLAHLISYNGKNYNAMKLDYWDYPWEIEASGRETGLYIRFINYMVDSGKL